MTADSLGVWQLVVDYRLLDGLFDFFDPPVVLVDC